MVFVPDQLPIHYLPDSVQNLVDLIGIKAVLVIVEERGGVRLYVPTTTSTRHWLAKSIGMTAFRILVDTYSGEEVEIPRCVDSIRALRELEILRDSSAGLSQTQLARKYGYTERGIRKLLQRVSASIDSDQIEMF